LSPGPHRRWGGAEAPYERFAAGKTSAQAEFISAEHCDTSGLQNGGVRFGRCAPSEVTQKQLDELHIAVTAHEDE